MLYVLSCALEVVARAVPHHSQMLIAVTALSLVLIAFFANPLGILNPLGSSSWSFGAFITLVAAAATVAGATLVMQKRKIQRA